MQLIITIKEDDNGVSIDCRRPECRGTKLEARYADAIGKVIVAAVPHLTREFGGVETINLGTGNPANS